MAGHAQRASSGTGPSTSPSLQLERLLEAADSPRITVQVMPFAGPAHPGLLGPFMVASFDNGPDAAYLDNALDGQITERRAQVGRVSLLYDPLRTESLSPGRHES